MKPYPQMDPRNLRAAVLVAAVSALALGGAVAYAQATPPPAAEHVDRATLAAAGSVVTQNGRWISRVEHPLAGKYVVTFTSGAFSAAPTCVATAVADEALRPGIVAPFLSCSPPTSASVSCQARAGGAPVDADIALICVGP